MSEVGVSVPRVPKAALGLVGTFALCFSAAALGALFPPGEWYAALRKPSWNPPSWIFGPVWTALYAMMAVAAWLLWRAGGFATHWRALTLFLLQLLLNAAWSPLFFGLHSPGLAMIDVLLLWIVLLATVISFLKANRLAAVLLVPYLLWVTFASILNATIWRLNS